jgi:hypothetical protein
MKCPECGSKWVQVRVDTGHGCECRECAADRNGFFTECLDCGWESEFAKAFAEALATLEGDSQ